MESDTVVELSSNSESAANVVEIDCNAPNGANSYSTATLSSDATICNINIQEPFHVIRYPAFKMTPIVMPSDIESSGGSKAIEFTLVGQTDDKSLNSSKKSGKRGVRRSALENTKTSLSLNFTNDDETVFYCEWDDCEQDFDDIQSFMKHVKVHVDTEIPNVSKDSDDRIDEDGFGCLWQDCLFVSSDFDEIVRHIHFHTFHTQLKSNGAEIIRTTGINSCRLDTSQRNIVPDLSEPFQCQWSGCRQFGTDFPEALKFYWHVLWHSEEYRGEKRKDLPCLWLDCGVKTGTVSKLRAHLRVHSQERVVGCPICGALFADRSKFFDHCKRQAPREELNFKCSVCNKGFALERILRNHMRQHIHQYKCEECNMTCPTRSALANHIAYRHTDEKNFPCKEPGCEYRATTNNDLISHVRTVHLGDNEFRCSYVGCNFRCKSKQTVKHHMNMAHKDALSRYCCHLCPQRWNLPSISDNSELLA